ncbi:Rab guanine nucleotide exchange factor sec2 [Daldinia childiae]|uniref:Rab guanine nucleotide exchange factor sec2 n=1 Tax=Daldinia childiae TaxID=326645 RepID=UPI0014459901|nr:Rab guanine nucleotide exchange factor sec2 [Daldinia childiae]KAF3054987.1 Rab guanine nucleotide exchange factor sec2 [Daldinia childiae]
MVWSSFIHVAAWSQHRSPSPGPQRTFGHLRSLSSMSPSAISRSRSPAKSHSSSNIAAEMMVPPTNINSLSVPEPRRMASQSSLMEDQDHSTIPDPRTRAASIASSNLHPDLDQEVAALSTKLINAINHQTNLDDTLSATRQDLEASRERIKELEAIVARQQETLSGDVWVKRKNVESEKSKLLARIVEEKRLRGEVEKDKKKIEQELETLTVSLFEEANRMVITAKEDAKKEQDILHRKNEQLKAQLADTESILRSQQEQLAELKLVMEQMTIEREDHCGTAPSSPGFSKFESGDDDNQISEGGPHSVAEQLVPTYPTNLPHLIHPVLRTDLHAYDDFMSLVQTSKRASDSRASSGSYSGLNPLLGLTSRHASAPSNSSTASLSTFEASSSNTSPQTPNTPASILSAGSTASSAPLPPLKDTKFYKRVLAEDIEPTLRLDTAPGLSWLARRSVLNAMTEGSLVVEPVPTTSPFQSISKPQFYPCSLCGEARKDEPHLRNHRFRTSESDSAQRYPLCKYCLDRVRSTCDFLGFLRMVKDGHWRTEDAESERIAWEESVRLRDQMFWSRIGGGVVPVISHIHSSNVEETSTRDSQDVNGTSVDENKTEAVQPITPDESESTPKPTELNQDDKSEHVIVSSEDQGAGSAGDSIEHLELTDLDAGKSQRLSLTIPDASSKEAPE